MIIITGRTSLRTHYDVRLLNSLGGFNVLADSGGRETWIYFRHLKRDL